MYQLIYNEFQETMDVRFIVHKLEQHVFNIYRC